MPKRKSRKKAGTGSRRKGRMGAAKANTSAIMDTALVVGGAIVAGFIGKAITKAVPAADKYNDYILLGAGLAASIFMKNHMVKEIGTGVAVAGALGLAKKSGLIAGVPTVPVIISRKATLNGAFTKVPAIGDINPVSGYSQPGAIGRMGRSRKVAGCM